MFPLIDLNLRLTCICSLLSDVNFARVVVTAEAEVSLMVPQIFLAPSTGTFGLEGPFDLLEDVWELSAWALLVFALFFGETLLLVPAFSAAA